MEGNENMEEKGLAQRIKESPRTVSALIIILIVAAAIYAFSGPQANQSPAPTENSEGVTDTAPNNEAENGNEEGEENQDEATPQITPIVRQTPSPSVTGRTPAPQSTIHPVTTEQISAQVQALPEGKQTEQGYMEVAQPGDGLTHLARRATTRWLASNETDFQITNEHRIYIEDYIQKKMGSKRLSLEQEETVSFELIQEAVAKAKDLNEQQLRNLSKYSSVLTP